MYLNNLNQLAETARKFDLLVPAKIVFDAGEFSKLSTLVSELSKSGSSIVLFGSASTKRYLEIAEKQLSEAGFTCKIFAEISGEPTVESVDQIAQQARDFNPDLVIAIGGGSVIDTAKAVAALITNDGSVEDYLEGVGSGKLIENDPISFVAVPTTSGTGAEMSKNAVITSYDKKYKKSFRDDRMLAKAVILDPELTLSVPAKISATTGLDALTQLIESCTSNKRKPATSTLSYMALKGATKALLEVVKNPSNLEARSKMMIASAVSGICLANSGLGMAHGIASALGAIYKIPHGEACGILLPHVVEYNSDAVIGELREAFAWMIEQPSATGDTIELGIKELKSVVAEIGVAADLKFLNLNDSQIRELAQKSIGNSLRGNPIPVDEDAVYEFLKRIA